MSVFLRARSSKGSIPLPVYFFPIIYCLALLPMLQTSLVVILLLSFSHISLLGSGSKELAFVCSVEIRGGRGGILRGNKSLAIKIQSPSCKAQACPPASVYPTPPSTRRPRRTAPRPRAAIGCEGGAAEDGIALYPARTSRRRQGHGGGGGGHRHREF